MSSQERDFVVDPNLAKDTAVVGDLTLCRVLLMNDSNYPWLVLVPRRVGVVEIYQLDAADQALLLNESSAVARLLQRHFSADKLNIAALGNVVSQLHLHHVVRYRVDRAWPKPVWGVVPAIPYSADALAHRIDELRVLFRPLRTGMR